MFSESELEVRSVSASYDTKDRYFDFQFGFNYIDKNLTSKEFDLLEKRIYRVFDIVRKKLKFPLCVNFDIIDKDKREYKCVIRNYGVEGNDKMLGMFRISRGENYVKFFTDVGIYAYGLKDYSKVVNFLNVVHKYCFDVDIFNESIIGDKLSLVGNDVEICGYMFDRRVDNLQNMSLINSSMVDSIMKGLHSKVYRRK